LLVVASVLKQRNVTIKRIEPLLNQFQDCYTEKYSWFVAYYLMCRLVIMLIVYFANSNYSNMIYYLQTACVIIAMTHVLIRPYKNYMLNVMDIVILLTLLLAINLSALNFSLVFVSGTVMVLTLLPLCLILVSGMYILYKFRKVAQVVNSKDGQTNQGALTR